MKKLFIAFMATLTMAMAAVSTDGLTEKQKAEIALQIANMKENADPLARPSSSSVDSFIENVSKFEAIGEQTGLAVKRSLEAVVDVADKFSNTPVGQITIALVIWRVVGDSLVLLFLGITVFTIGLLIFKRTFFERKIPIKYEDVPILWGLLTIRRASEYRVIEAKGENQAAGIIILMISTIIFVVAIANT